MIPPATIGHEIDVSEHQHPDALPWDAYRGHVQLVTCRASYGAEHLDSACEEHMKRAKEIGARRGLYIFFRPSQSWQDQYAAFGQMSQRCALEDRDVCPTLDIERDPFPRATLPDPSWNAQLEAFASALSELWSSCMLYITRADWILLGRPSWMLERDLWVAEYGSTLNAPDGAESRVVAWQRRVGKFTPGGDPPGVFDNGTADQIDQSWILRPLPLCGGGRWDPSIPEATS